LNFTDVYKCGSLRIALSVGNLDSLSTNTEAYKKTTQFVENNEFQFFLAYTEMLKAKLRFSSLLKNSVELAIAVQKLGCLINNNSKSAFL
jgi:hypothetical protein